MRKIIAGLVATAAVATPLAIAAPAHAVQQSLNCTGAGSADVSGYIKVLHADGDSSRFEVTGYLTEANGSHSWDWLLKHNGFVSDSGTASGPTFRPIRTMINWDGVDTFRFRADSANGAITCIADAAF